MGGTGSKHLIPLSILDERRKMAASEIYEYSAPRSAMACGNNENRT